MIKTSTGSIYAYIKRVTEENGGTPPIIGGHNIPFTYDNWKMLDAIAGFELEEETLDNLFVKIWN